MKFKTKFLFVIFVKVGRFLKKIFFKKGDKKEKKKYFIGGRKNKKLKKKINQVPIGKEKSSLYCFAVSKLLLLKFKK